jgi:hypothetical protein
VATFANSDTYGYAGIKSFQDAATAIGVQILYSAIFPKGQQTYSTIVSEAKASGAKIFVLFLDTQDASYLLEQGFDAGLFTEGTQIIGSDYVTISQTWQGISTREKAAKIMKGYLGVSLYSDLISEDTLGPSFMKRFTSLPPTNGANGECSSDKDDNGGYLFQDYDTATGTTYCGGTNYSEISLDGMNMDPYVPYAYDSVYAAAMALHVNLYEQNMSHVDGPTLFRTLIDNVSFVGVSGHVSFSKALTDDEQRYAEGDRMTGVKYGIYNFQPDLYWADSAGSSGLSLVGKWESETGVLTCGETSGLSETCQIVYNTADNSIPSDTAPDILLKLSPQLQKVLYAVAGILFTMVFVFFALLMVFRRSKLMKMSQMYMLVVVLVGGAIGAARVLVGGMLPSTAVCTGQFWTGHLAFWLIFGTLGVKTWRLHKVINATLKRIKITENYVLRIVLLSVMIVVVFMAFSTKYGCPQIDFAVTYSNNQETRELQCSMVHAEFQIVLFVVEFMALVVGARMCWITRNVPDAVNESKYIFSGQHSSLFASYGSIVWNRTHD